VDPTNQTSTTTLITIINNDLCTAGRYYELGNVQPGGIIVDTQFISSDNPARIRQFYLANVYIRLKAKPLDTKTLMQAITKTIDYKTSRLLLVGDLNASSALWDPQNLDNTTKALKTKNKFYSDKTQSGAIIERFALRHNLRVLPQVGRPTHTFIEPAGSGENSDHFRGSLINIALVSRKANRVWHAVKVGRAEGDRSRRHLAIEVLASNERQTGPKHKMVFRYRPERILHQDLIELKVKASKLRNNWKC